MWTMSFQMFKLDLEKAEEPEIKLPISAESSKKQESSRKTSISALLTAPKPLIVWITTNWNILKEMGIPDYLTWLLRNLYADQEATFRTRHGTTDSFQIGKGVHQGCILSTCLFNFYTEYIMWNAERDEAQAGIKVAGRNINNLRYADDTTLMAEREEELKSLLMKVKEQSEKGGLKFNIQKTKIMASSPTMHACMPSHFSHVQPCATLWTAAHQPPPSTGFSRQEYWSGLPFPSPPVPSFHGK